MILLLFIHKFIFEGTQPTGTPIVNSPVNCNFEKPCAYFQDTTDRFDWTRNSRGTNSGSTGPSADHTYGTNRGHYMYTEASAPRKRGDAAR